MFLCHIMVISLRHKAELKPTQLEREVRLLLSAGVLEKAAPQIQGTLLITYTASNQFGQKPQQRLKPTWWLREEKGKSAAERWAGIWGNTALFFCILSKCSCDAGAEVSACLLMMHTYIWDSLIAINPMRLAPCSGEMLDWAGTETADSLFLRVIAFLHSSPPPSRVRAAHIRLPFIVSINVLSGCWVNTSSGSRPVCSSHHSFLSKLLFSDALVWG